MAFTFAKGMYTVKIGKSDPENTIMLEPNIARMPDGGIIACYTTGGNFEPDLRNVTKYRISYDNGRTWGEEKILFRHPQKVCIHRSFPSSVIQFMFSPRLIQEKSDLNGILQAT